MKILGILQNQWFRDPDRVRKMIERTPEVRPRLIATALFMGCATGKNLKVAFGGEVCGEVVWEESSPQIGGHSSSVFPADLEHIRRRIAEVNPYVVMTFGKIATDAVLQVAWPEGVKRIIITSLHPAYRDRAAAMASLRTAARELEEHRAQYARELIEQAGF